ncbi:lysylphosphatidylglycerol synthase domain-containing protein (plasmid) [Nicoliella spurrieriana]|uniref:Phosphatidylglycerol lysyltransferase n=1 Tax=Nicoliella spurrieriana TaxID=2925830 RepID=A0A976X4L8_9LACO|nr:lysylphosphatidylglycerol synthase domain-containing protein [Nicoliella spurrieriana]UQS86053.1 lysylphosphatidylglycerol synthase domain-containing protein [Nicoliella spurrieriana]
MIRIKFIDKIADSFSKYSNVIKRIYVVLIIAFVIYSIHSIFEQISFHKLSRASHLLSTGSLITLIILGAVSIIPMMIYDFTYTRKVKMNISMPELITSSYVINTFTNIGGSGGLVGASLRIFLFGNVKEDNKETAKIVTQIALFTMTGLVINDIAAVIMNLDRFGAEKIWIKVVCLLFPLYLLVPLIAKNDTLNRRDLLHLLIGSTLEWVCCLGFFLSIGLFMHINFDFRAAYLGLVFAGIVGAMSLIPGGIGSFEVALTLGLNNAGISTDIVVIWALVYRICYYFIPFALGMVMLIVKYFRRRSSSTLSN